VIRTRAGFSAGALAKKLSKSVPAASSASRLCWLTGYSTQALQAQLHGGVDYQTFFAEAPAMNPAWREIKGTICGVRIEGIEDPLMREIRYLDKLIDELARGKAMERIFRE